MIFQNVMPESTLDNTKRAKISPLLRIRSGSDVLREDIDSNLLLIPPTLFDEVADKSKIPLGAFFHILDEAIYQECGVSKKTSNVAIVQNEYFRDVSKHDPLALFMLKHNIVKLFDFMGFNYSKTIDYSTWLQHLVYRLDQFAFHIWPQLLCSISHFSCTHEFTNEVLYFIRKQKYGDNFPFALVPKVLRFFLALRSLSKTNVELNQELKIYFPHWESSEWNLNNVIS
tara:strand:- start:1867 stop:2550 length:684 start_codon:yes stop_codon:yes gene_type:complete